MGKSIQAINLENIMRELQMLAGGEISLSAGKKRKSKSNKKVQVSAGISSSYDAEEEEEDEDENDDGLSKEERDQIISVYGYVPEHLKKKQKKKEKKEPHLLKPSDFFGG